MTAYAELGGVKLVRKNGGWKEVTFQQKRIGKMVRKYRNDMEITQVELAKRIGTTKRIVSCLERGKYNPSMTMLIRFADALGVKVKDLL